MTCPSLGQRRTVNERHIFETWPKISSMQEYLSILRVKALSFKKDQCVQLKTSPLTPHKTGNDYSGLFWPDQ